jgi:hypothetical protein
VTLAQDGIGVADGRSAQLSPCAAGFALATHRRSDDGLQVWGNGLHHTYRTLCAELGIDEVLVHMLMGHALKSISRGYIARLVLQSGSAMRAAQATISRRIVAPLVGVKCSQMTEHRTMYYAVLSDGGSLTYGSTGFFATDKTAAAQKAKDWAKSFDLVQENAWLQVTANGVGVCTLRPGELRELRAQA